ncbi:GWxTD domain-containing protein [Bacteroidota bacterium]
MNKIKYWIIILIAAITVSCKVSQKTTAPRNLHRIYDPASSSIHPNITVYNTSDTSSEIVERVYTKELLFNQANTENRLLARIQVIYNLYDINDKHNLVDSATTTYKFEKNSEILYHTLKIPVKSVVGNNYLLEIITSDLNRKSHQYTFRRIDRTKEISLLDFAFYNKSNDKIFANPFIKDDREFTIKNYKKNYDSLNVHFFSNDFIVPQPPYIKDTTIETIEIPDTSWICYLDSINYQDFNREGIYYFTEDDNLDLNKGFSLFNFGKAFPIVQTPDDLAKPIVYLDSVDLISDNDSTGKLTKLAVDNFWLGKANNLDKSKELLKIYYNRVMFANMYFTSYKEGWQTDRGMIYIIYGLPDYLFKSGEEERWIYNPEGIGTGITFTFKYIETPFSFNHYELDREKLKVTGWDEAIKMWNNGEIFYFQN